MHDCEYINCQGCRHNFQRGGGTLWQLHAKHLTLLCLNIISSYFCCTFLAIQLSLGWRQLEFHLTLTIPYLVYKSLLQSGRPPLPHLHPWLFIKLSVKCFWQFISPIQPYRLWFWCWRSWDAGWNSFKCHMDSVNWVGCIILHFCANNNNK